MFVRASRFIVQRAHITRDTDYRVRLRERVRIVIIRERPLTRFIVVMFDPLALYRTPPALYVFDRYVNRARDIVRARVCHARNESRTIDTFVNDAHVIDARDVLTRELFAQRDNRIILLGRHYVIVMRDYVTPPSCVHCNIMYDAHAYAMCMNMRVYRMRRYARFIRSC